MTEKRRVAIFGSTGQLGTDLVDVLGASDSFAVVAITHDDADCTDPAAVRNVLLTARPQVVINCAAFVRVDDCEDRPDEAFRVNAIGAFNIAKVCAELDATCVYVSTDYVFDGTKGTPYVESDPPCPINVYGASKLAGEHLVRQSAPRWLIVRVASLFGRTGARGKGGNFIETILAKAKNGEVLKVIDNISVSPTYTRDATWIIKRLLKDGATGFSHAANRGSCTWFELAKTTLDLCGLQTSIEAVPADAFPTRARRPRNSALLREALSTAEIRSWKDALRDYLIERGHLKPDA